MNTINIIITDDVRMTRLGLSFLLQTNPIFDVIGEAENGRFLLGMNQLQKATIVLMDVNMPVMNGIDATKEITEKFPNVKVIALTNDNGEESIQAMTKAGAKGFLMKNVQAQELHRAIQIVASGGTYIAPELISYYNKSNIFNTSNTLYLNTLQKNILDLLCKGYSVAEIAKKLTEDLTIIEYECNELLKVTKTRNAVSLVLFAIKNKLVEL